MLSCSLSPGRKNKPLKNLELGSSFRITPFPSVCAQLQRIFPVQPPKLYPPLCIHTEARDFCHVPNKTRRFFFKSSTKHFTTWPYVLQCYYTWRAVARSWNQMIIFYTLLHKPTYFSQIALSRNVHQGHTPAPEQRGLFNQLLWRDPARRHQLRPSQLLSSSTALHAEVAGHSCCFWHSFDSVFLVSRRQKERNLPGSAFPRLHIFEPLQSRVGPERHLSCSRSLG